MHAILIIHELHSFLKNGTYQLFLLVRLTITLTMVLFFGLAFGGQEGEMVTEEGKVGDEGALYAPEGGGGKGA